MIITFNKNNFKKFDIWLFLTLFAWGLYFTYVWLHMLYYDPSGNLMAGWINVWGDFPAHFAYSAPFAYRSVFNWLNVNPLFMFSKFNYPFLSDALSGILIRMGLDLTKAFIYPSIILSFLLLFNFFKFAYQLTKNKFSSFLSITIFMLGGGLGFIHFINEDLFKFITSHQMPRQYTQMDNIHIKWINPIISELVPQRAFLLALPLTLLILYKLNQYAEMHFKVRKIKLILLGLLSGILPIIHMHSFIALFIICAFLFIYNIKSFKALLLFAISVAIPAIIIYLSFFYKQIDTKTFIEYFPGWMANKKEFNEPILNFWWWNFGLFLPFSIISYFYLKLYKNYLYTAAFFIFIICHLYKFQPWAWDNSKLLTYWYLVFSIAISKLISVTLLKKREIFKSIPNFLYGYLNFILALLVIFVLTFSGFLDVVNLANYKKNSILINSKLDIEASYKINSLIQDKDVVLTSTRHNNPISNFTKAQVVMGYAGWLWSYGINFGPTLDDIYIMYRDPKNSKVLFKKYNVKYVLISNAERSEYSPNEDYFEDNYKEIYKNTDYRLFVINR